MLVVVNRYVDGGIRTGAISRWFPIQRLRPLGHTENDWKYTKLTHQFQHSISPSSCKYTLLFTTTLHTTQHILLTHSPTQSITHSITHSHTQSINHTTTHHSSPRVNPSTTVCFDKLRSVTRSDDESVRESVFHPVCLTLVHSMCLHAIPRAESSSH